MKYFNIIFLLLYFHSIDLLGQWSIQCTVKDEKKEPIAFANVLLLSADSAFIKAELTDENGIALLKPENAGVYLCEISMLGYGTRYTSPFELNSSTFQVELPEVILNNTLSLETVEIVAKRPLLEQKSDRMIINVANSIANTGSNALEVLQRSPGILVNRQTNSISVLGKQGVVIMINGKISRMPQEAITQALEAMNANNIDRIEIVHNPPANFDAEGNAGIINIILKRDFEEGINGSYFVTGGYGRKGKYSLGTNLNYRKKYINIFGNYDRNYNWNPQLFTNYRGVIRSGGFYETDTRSNRPHTPTTTQNGLLGFDVQLSSKSILGAQATFFKRHWYMEAVSHVTESLNGVAYSKTIMPVTETNSSQSIAGNINFQHEITPTSKFFLEVDYVKFNINNPSFYTIDRSDGQGPFKLDYSLDLTKTTPVNVFVSKADYTFNIRKIAFESGVKFTKYNFENIIHVDSISANNERITLGDYTSTSVLNEHIAAAYGSFQYNPSTKTEVKGGLRYEYTSTLLSTEKNPNLVNRNYGNFFPSLFFLYKISENQSLTLAYSRRIFRPQISQIAPFLVFVDPTTLLGGNPALQPSLTNSVTINYGIHGWKFGISLSREDAPIRFVPILDVEKNRQVTGPSNLKDETVTNITVYKPIQFYPWWESYNTITGNHILTNAILDAKEVKLENYFVSVNTSHNFKLSKTFLVELTGNYNSPSYFGVALFRPTGSLNIGIQKTLPRAWGSIRANLYDIFESTNWIGHTDIPENNLLVDASFRFAERKLMVTWANNFGSQKVKKLRDRQEGASEEKNRIQ